MQIYSHFEEKGYRFEAYIPTSDEDVDAFEIRVLAGGEIKKTLYLPLLHLPVFGVDVDDVSQLEAFADAMMKALPEASGYDATASSALDAIERQFGGAAVRVKLSLPPPRSGPGQFVWTRDVFVTTMANVLGDREAAERWMGAAAQELGGRSPEEALRLGMAQAVLGHLVKSEGRRK